MHLNKPETNFSESSYQDARNEFIKPFENDSLVDGSAPEESLY